MRLEIISGPLVKDAEIVELKDQEGFLLTATILVRNELSKTDTDRNLFYNVSQFFKSEPKNAHLFTKGTICDCSGTPEQTPYQKKDGTLAIDYKIRTRNLSAHFSKADEKTESSSLAKEHE